MFSNKYEWLDFTKKVVPITANMSNLVAATFNLSDDTAVFRFTDTTKSFTYNPGCAKKAAEYLLNRLKFQEGSKPLHVEKLYPDFDIDDEDSDSSDDEDSDPSDDAEKGSEFKNPRTFSIVLLDKVNLIVWEKPTPPTSVVNLVFVINDTMSLEWPFPEDESLIKQVTDIFDGKS